MYLTDSALEKKTNFLFAHGCSNWSYWKYGVRLKRCRLPESGTWMQNTRIVTQHLRMCYGLLLHVMNLQCAPKCLAEIRCCYVSLFPYGAKPGDVL